MRKLGLLAFAALATLVVWLALVAAASDAWHASGRTFIGSTGYLGQANSWSEDSDISRDGRFVTFSSFASNLVPGDTNRLRDVFVRDVVAGTTERVSVASDGAQTQRGDSWDPAISDDGRFVVFYSVASNLVLGGTSDSGTYVHDRVGGTTERVSVNDAGEPANAPVWTDTDISGDGRYVVFVSTASNLVPNDAFNCGVGGYSWHCFDIYVRDRAAGTTRRVSVSSDGEPGNSSSVSPSISSNGRYVAFESGASNLAPGGQRGGIFAHDLNTGRTELVSQAMDGGSANGPSGEPSISSSGRFVAFGSRASNLVPADTNTYCANDFGGGPPDPTLYNCWDVFVRDRLRGTTERVSVDSTGREANNWSGGAAISSSGRFVAFVSQATNLVSGDLNGYWDVFIHDRLTHVTVRQSVSDDLTEANNHSYFARISGDGSAVSFASWATNLVPEDTAMCGIVNCMDIFVRDAHHRAD